MKKILALAVMLFVGSCTANAQVCIDGKCSVQAVPVKAEPKVASSTNSGWTNSTAWTTHLEQAFPRPRTNLRTPVRSAVRGLFQRVRCR